MEKKFLPEDEDWEKVEEKDELTKEASDEPLESLEALIEEELDEVKEEEF